MNAAIIQSSEPVRRFQGSHHRSASREAMNHLFTEVESILKGKDGEQRADDNSGDPDRLLLCACIPYRHEKRNRFGDDGAAVWKGREDSLLLRRFHSNKKWHCFVIRFQGPFRAPPIVMGLWLRSRPCLALWATTARASISTKSCWMTRFAPLSTSKANQCTRSPTRFCRVCCIPSNTRRGRLPPSSLFRYQSPVFTFSIRYCIVPTSYSFLASLT